MYERTFVVGDGEAGRLDRFLEGRHPDVSRARVRRAILDGAVTVNGTSLDRGRPVAPGDVVALRMEADFVRAMGASDVPLAVLYEDEWLLAVDKPSGMLAHPTSRVHEGTALNAVAHYLDRERSDDARNASADGPALSSSDASVRPLLVHRLDQATSGVLLVSKTLRAHAIVSRQFERRRVTKRYVALLCGELRDESGESSRPTDGVIDAPIGGSRETMPGFAVRPDGRPAQTRYRVAGGFGPYALVELEPLTGRTNQLRIHCAHAGAPIAGEDLHGLDLVARFRLEHSEAPVPPRLFLHAALLELAHPETNAPLRIESPLPAELTDFLGLL